MFAENIISLVLPILSLSLVVRLGGAAQRARPRVEVSSMQGALLTLSL